LILKNAKIYSAGLVRKGAIYIDKGVIKSVCFDINDERLYEISQENEDGYELDCESKLILPGIIDIHSHLRDMEQAEKETFLTGTQAAAYSGITTVFNMPNTKPPAITAEQVKKWMIKAQHDIFVNVGFISGVPKGIDEVEIKRILELGVVGFKIYPHDPLNDVDWMVPENMQKILELSSKFQVRIFIHPELPISINKKEKVHERYKKKEYSDLKIHDIQHSIENEKKCVEYIMKNYQKITKKYRLTYERFPIVHFCHVSNKKSYLILQHYAPSNKISFEVTPHHLFLSNQIKINNPAHAKVLPPLRDEIHSKFLYEELKNGKIKLMGTDHAPHTLQEKSENFYNAPAGFPGFETYSLILLDKACKFDLPLSSFVRASSEYPALTFGLKNKGFIKEGHDADLIIINKVPEYPINPLSFKSKAKFSPFSSYMTSVAIWKVILSGEVINREDARPIGKIIRSSI